MPTGQIRSFDRNFAAVFRCDSIEFESFIRLAINAYLNSTGERSGKCQSVINVRWMSELTILRKDPILELAVVSCAEKFRATNPMRALCSVTSEILEIPRARSVQSGFPDSTRML